MFQVLKPEEELTDNMQSVENTLKCPNASISCNKSGMAIIWKITGFNHFHLVNQEANDQPISLLDIENGCYTCADKFIPVQWRLNGP